ncbi:MAG: methionine adenosyltransferase [Candidatus Beckwithbacteria bacterium]
MKSPIIISFKRFDKEACEFVERKGLGHPDTLADALAEELSAKYSCYTLEKYGAILHHNFDKLGILGGSSHVSFGKGFLTQPIRILLNGRVSVSFGKEKIPVKKMLVKWAREFFSKKLPLINPEKDLDICYNISSQSSPGKTKEKGSKEGTRKYWFRPRNLDDVQELSKLSANDTSLGVGYAPPTKLERLILKVEAGLNSSDFKKSNPWIGSDIKILGFRNKESYSITICIPQIANFVRNVGNYKKNLIKAEKKIFEIAKKQGVKKLDVNINTRDNFETLELYLTATGSSIESGDEGLVGRGNRINGLISPMKPLSMEGACGKNPVYHIGKVYYLVADIIAKKIHKKLNIPVEVYLASQSGRDLLEPWVILLRVPHGFKDIEKLTRLVKHNINKIPNLTKKIIHQKILLY